MEKGREKNPVLRQECQESLSRPHPFPLASLSSAPTTVPSREKRLWGRAGRHRPVLTKKSKLKRKRKYLVTLTQAAPMLLVLELSEDERGDR